MILSIAVFFAGISFLILLFMNRSIAKEVTVIREGLDQIADNNLSYRLPTDFQQGGLPEIAQNINEMSARLNENIQKAYYFELKQKDAQLAELQTAFNPHFLYNTLEMLRSKSFSNGDIETADLISQLSALFRGFINAKTFISLKEELNFSNRYFTLLSARYGDMVEDNGSGMTDEALQELNQQIAQPIRHGDKSYGLKNLNQRLKLFCGPDYGLWLSHSEKGGLCVQIKLKKLRVEDYEKTRLTPDPIIQPPVNHHGLF